MKDNRVLFVDDEANILKAYQRRLRNTFRVDTALGAEEALEKITGPSDYAVICTDMKMPGMDGIELLEKVRRRAPDTVRMMLTGVGDLEIAVAAVNEGNVFRFLTKPCSNEDLAQALREALRQHQLVTAERELLSKTLKSTIKILVDALSLANPTAFSRSLRLRDAVGELGKHLQPDESWRFEIAAMLSQVGCLTLSQESLERLYRREPLTEAEKAAFENHPAVGSQLVGEIPRMARVAKIIKYQEKRFDGGGLPEDGRHGNRIPLGARLLKAAGDFLDLLDCGAGRREAIARMRAREGWYDPDILKALEVLTPQRRETVETEVVPAMLRPGMVLTQDVHSSDGILLLSKGSGLTALHCQRLKNSLQGSGDPGKIRVLVEGGRPAAETPGPEQGLAASMER